MVEMDLSSFAFACVCVCNKANSHLIGKQGRPTTASRSTPQAAVLFFSVLDDLEMVREVGGE